MGLPDFTTLVLLLLPLLAIEYPDATETAGTFFCTTFGMEGFGFWTTGASSLARVTAGAGKNTSGSATTSFCGMTLSVISLTPFTFSVCVKSPLLIVITSEDVHSTTLSLEIVRVRGRMINFRRKGEDDGDDEGRNPWLDVTKKAKKTELVAFFILDSLRITFFCV